MKILIPDHILNKHFDQIKSISNDIEIVSLKVVNRERFIHKLTRKLAGRFLSYRIYLKLQNFLSSGKSYRFFADGKPLNGPLNDVDVFLATWVIDKEAFNNLKVFLPNVQWIHSMKGGIESLDGEFIRANNIVLTNSRGIHSTRIAEFVLACIFDVTKHISYHADLKRKKAWEEIKSTELKGQTVGILGVGSIGCEIARLSKLLGMNVIGCNRSNRSDENFNKIVKFDQIQKFIGESDYLIICLPSDKGTVGLIGANELSAMKKDAYIINVGRSDVVVEQALIKTLKSNSIAGAVLDIFHPGMQLPIHPYYKLNNVLLTHYSAHASISSNTELNELFLKNLKCFVNGDTLNNVVTL